MATSGKSGSKSGAKGTSARGKRGSSADTAPPARMAAPGPGWAATAGEEDADPARFAPGALPPGVGARPPLPLHLSNTHVTVAPDARPAALKVLPFDVKTSMDPRLQLAIANRRSGKPGLTLSSANGDEVAVVARVTSPEAWEALPDIVPGCTLGQTEDGSWIVTGRTPIKRLETVHGSTDVLSLKASQTVRPNLAATVAEMGIAPASLPAGTAPNGGEGVVVGIVDFGCDFAHRNVLKANGRTRIEALWNQAGAATTTSPFGYGRLFTAAQIDAALNTANPYATLGYGPAPDTPQRVGAHGTHVMDIAAGNGRGSGQAGVAPKATIVFVEAATADIAWQGPGTVNQAFGDSVQLLEAVRFVFDRAANRPCVVNLSLGTNGGPHDGTSLVEQGLDALVNEKANRAVVIAASNSQEDGIHTAGRVGATGNHNIVWDQSPGGGGEVELWYPGARRLQVSLIAPDGTVFGPVAPGANLPIGQNGDISIFISNRLDDPNNHDNVIGIWVAGGLGDGNWTIRLRSVGGGAVDYHAWVERDDNAQSSFATPVPTHTLGSISTGRQTIAVGSYDAHKVGLPLSSFSSSGPTREGRQKPELSAPGHAVIAARSRTVTGVVRKSGTSMAAPAVTGLVALIFAEARRKGQTLTIAELRQRLIDHAAKNPPAGGAGSWDPRYGFGRASGASVA